MKQYLFVIVGIITIVILLAAGGGQISPPYSGGGGGGAVASVFGRTGAVTAIAADYSAFFPTSIYCGLTTTCANTSNSGAKIVRGITAGFLGDGTNQQTITLSGASAFSNTTYECTFTAHTPTPVTADATSFTISKISGTSFVVTELPTSATDLAGYICTGN